MEADGGSQAAFDNLTIAYEKDQDDLMEQYRDTIEYHSEEFSDKLSAIDAKFHAIGAIPPSMEFDTDDSAETTPRRPRTSSGCESITMVDVQHAETRLSNKLRELDRDRPRKAQRKTTPPQPLLLRLPHLPSLHQSSVHQIAATTTHTC